MTVLLLTGFLFTILMRVLKADFIKYTRDDEAGVDLPSNSIAANMYNLGILNFVIRRLFPQPKEY